MNKCFKKVLLAMFLSLLPNLHATFEKRKKGVEWFFCYTNHGIDYLSLACQKMNLLLKAIEDNKGEDFLDAFKNLYSLSSAEREELWRTPLKEEESTFKLEYFTGKDFEFGSFNLLQIAIKKQAFNVVHALLLQSIEVDVNEMNTRRSAIPNLALAVETTDLLMLAVKNMKDEEGLKILAALIAAGITCDNSNYPSSGETPLTYLIKRGGGMSEDLIKKGAILLINAGFDPYEARHSDSMPFIQAVVKGEKYGSVVAASIRCFGKKHQNDPVLVDSEKFKKELNRFTLPHNSLASASYESITQAALPALGEAEEIMKTIAAITKRKLWLGHSLLDPSFSKESIDSALLAEKMNVVKKLKVDGDMATTIGICADEFSLDPQYLETRDPLKGQVQHYFDQVEGRLKEEAPKVVPTSSTSSSTTSSSSSAASTTSASIQMPPNTSSSLQPLGSSSRELPPQQGGSPKQASTQNDNETITGTFEHMSALQKTGLGLLAIGLIGGMAYVINKLRSQGNKKHENGPNGAVKRNSSHNRYVSYS